MFKGTKNIAAMNAAKTEVEQQMNTFEKDVFSAEQNGLSVTLLGDMTIQSIAGDGQFTATDFERVYQTALEQLKHARSLNLVRIRNKINKQFRFDIANMFPEVATAVRYLDALQKAKQAN
jgi:predicted DNA-binding ribbon-helix-helix protein